MKKIIFDVDGTLLLWKSYYINALKETLIEYNIYDEHLLKAIDSIIENQEKKYSIWDNQVFLNEINKTCNVKLDYLFVNSLFDKQSKFIDYDEKLIELLDYLSQKYYLVIFTNYVKQVQESRLKNACIYNYFKELYYGDQIKFKPNLESLKMVINSYNRDDCYMVGDSIHCDINPALKLGIKPILIDKEDNHEKTKKYIKIKTIYDLKDIL